MRGTRVNVGLARQVTRGARRAASAIAIGKQAVAGRVAVRSLGLTGDEQADLGVHGGLPRAIYAFPGEHLGFWRTVRAQAGVALWDDALARGIEFNAAMGFAQASGLMDPSGCCGFCLAVRAPGTVEAGEAFSVEPGPREVRVDRLFRARMPSRTAVR